MVRLRLFIHGDSPRSAKALRHLAEFQEQHGEEFVSIEVVDVLTEAQVAAQAKILATPTVVRVLPLPSVRIVGDLSDQAALESLLIQAPKRLM